jgi:hypothetical protein
MLAHALLREYIYKRLKLAQLLGQLVVFLTWPQSPQAEDHVWRIAASRAAVVCFVDFGGPFSSDIASSSLCFLSFRDSLKPLEDLFCR